LKQSRRRRLYLAKMKMKMKVMVLTPAGEYSPLPPPFSLSSLCSCVFHYGFSPLLSLFSSLCFFLFSFCSPLFSPSVCFLCFLYLFFLLFFYVFLPSFFFLCSTDCLVFIGINLPLPQPTSLLLISMAGGVSFC